DQEHDPELIAFDRLSHPPPRSAQTDEPGQADQEQHDREHLAGDPEYRQEDDDVVGHQPARTKIRPPRPRSASRRPCSSRSQSTTRVAEMNAATPSPANSSAPHPKANRPAAGPGSSPRARARASTPRASTSRSPPIRRACARACTSTGTSPPA